MKKTIKALKELNVGSRLVAKGELFEADEIDADYYVTRKQGEYATRQVAPTQTKPMVAAPAAAPVVEPEPVVARQEVPEPQPSTERRQGERSHEVAPVSTQRGPMPAAKRAYTRRDDPTAGS
jgi:hypothetical protein